VRIGAFSFDFNWIDGKSEVVIARKKQKWIIPEWIKMM